MKRLFRETRKASSSKQRRSGMDEIADKLGHERLAELGDELQEAFAAHENPPRRAAAR